MSERRKHNQQPDYLDDPAVRADSSGDVQLRLLSGGAKRPDWLLDERTRLVGREGVAQAREVLRRARPPELKQPAAVRKAS